MITWVPLAQLDEGLRGYGPIGLRLRPLFHARTERDPTALIAGAPEELVEEGLDAASAWAGWDDDVPFLIRSVPLLLAGGYGLEVSVPVCTAGNGALLATLARLPLPPLTSLYFDALESGPFGVRDLGTRSVIYRSPSRQDAAAVARFASAGVGAAHEVVELPAAPPRLMVLGPASGPFVSRVEEARDRADAARLAEARTRTYGAEFRVIEL